MCQQKLQKLQGIYAISDTKLTPNHTLHIVLEQAIKGGISLFQLRDKTTPKEELKHLCEKLSHLCAHYKIPFILNDHISLAISLKTDGLHIGKNEKDEPYSLKELQQIRAQYQGILGVSCYGNLELANNAIAAGADYLAFGACFASLTKPQSKTIDLNIFQQAKEKAEIPLCAIGGINAHNINQLKNVQMVACVHSIWSGDITTNVQELLKAWKT